MDFLQNSYIVDEYNWDVRTGKTITKYAEEYGVEKINKYLDSFNYDFFVEYGSESEGAGLKVSLGSGKMCIRDSSMPEAFPSTSTAWIRNSSA